MFITSWVILIQSVVIWYRKSCHKSNMSWIQYYTPMNTALFLGGFWFFRCHSACKTVSKGTTVWIIKMAYLKAGQECKIWEILIRGCCCPICNLVDLCISEFCCLRYNKRSGWKWYSVWNSVIMLPNTEVSWFLPKAIQIEPCTDCPH